MRHILQLISITTMQYYQIFSESYYFHLDIYRECKILEYGTKVLPSGRADPTSSRLNFRKRCRLKIPDFAMAYASIIRI